MKKIKSLFKRNYSGDRLVYDELVEGSEWVANGEGVATIKVDGTCCLMRDGILYRRYDRKLTKLGKKLQPEQLTEDCFKVAPKGWEPAEETFNVHTGHWPGWVPVGWGPSDRWHKLGLGNTPGDWPEDGTYELVGPKVQANPYGLDKHVLWRHGVPFGNDICPPRDFEGLQEWLRMHAFEGIVWHHPDGRMVKIKRKDFGFSWPDPMSPNVGGTLVEVG